MSREEIIYQVLEFVKEKFKDKKDKNGEPYIWHLVRVALNQDTFNGKIVGLLHDIFEDTDTTDEELYNLEIPDYLIKDILRLTHEDETYNDYINEINWYGSDIAKNVKIADLKDNLLKERNPKESLEKRYITALNILQNGSEEND